jgi:hypothetical protein
MYFKFPADRNGGKTADNCPVEVSHLTFWPFSTKKYINIFLHITGRKMFCALKIRNLKGALIQESRI